MSNGLPGPTKRDLAAQFAAIREERGPVVPNNGRSGRYAPRQTRPRHRMIVMLHESGWTNREIAQALGYTEGRVSIILNSSNPELRTIRAEFARTVAENITDTALRFKLYANEALDTMVRHMRDTEHPNLSRMAARDILDRAGYSPVKKQMNLNTQLPAAELQEVVERLDKSNEVVQRSREWAVRPVDTRVQEAEDGTQ